MATKTSILVFYLRLAENTQIVLRYASWTTLVIVNVAGTVLTVMNIFQCNPIDAAWSPLDGSNPRCIPLLTEFICAAPINIVTDLAILALPIPVLTGMRLPLRQKTILVLTFTLGVFVSIVDVVRIYYLQHAITSVPTGISSNPQSTFGGSADFAWRAAISLMWSAVEVNIGITCACIPLLKPLILKLLPAMLYDPNGTLTSSQKGSDGSEPPSSQNHPDTDVITSPTPVAFPSSRPTSAALDQDSCISAMQFLTMPEGMESDSEAAPAPTSPHRQRAIRTVSVATTHRENAVYFGFVNITKPKSMLKTNATESWKYCTTVSVLFLLWGISYGLLNTLNNAIGSLNGMTAAQTLGLTSAYFGGGYFFGPLLVGEWILRRDEHNRSKRHKKDQADNIGGFKVTFIVGLCIYGIGTIIFWPSAVTNSYGGFMLSNFVVGFGLSVLEVGANAFLVLCGPPEHGETRLLLAQGVQGIGSVLSGLLAEKVFFKAIPKDGTSNSITLINVQWTYLGITLLCVALGLFFYYMPLPEVSDSELEASANLLPVNPKKPILGKIELRTVNLVLAIFTQYLYVGAQESNSIFFSNLMVSLVPSEVEDVNDAMRNSSSTADTKPPGIALSIPEYLLLAHSAFTVSRFIVAWLTWKSAKRPSFPQPRTFLTICIGFCFLFALLPVVLRPTNPNLLIIPIILFFFFEGPIWPLVFAIGLRGQGRRTKRAAAFITMGAAGPAFFPFIMYGVIDRGGSIQTAFVLVITLQAAIIIYPLFLETVRDVQLMVDPQPRVNQTSVDEESNTGSLMASRHHESTMISEKGNNLFEKVSKGLVPRFITSTRRLSQRPEFEHREHPSRSSQ